MAQLTKRHYWENSINDFKNFLTTCKMSYVNFKKLWKILPFRCTTRYKDPDKCNNSRRYLLLLYICSRGLNSGADSKWTFFELCHYCSERANRVGGECENTRLRGFLRRWNRSVLCTSRKSRWCNFPRRDFTCGDAVIDVRGPVLRFRSSPTAADESSRTYKIVVIRCRWSVRDDDDDNMVIIIITIYRCGGVGRSCSFIKY